MMAAPRFLTAAEIHTIHRDQIERYGGILGLRDDGLLSSALATPESSWAGAYLHRDLFEMAAAYLFHLVKNHPFVDGNKRVGAVSAYIFLRLNGLQLNASEDAFADFVLEVATDVKSKADAAAFFKQHCSAI